MPGNDRLAALMREAGFLVEDGSVGRKVFARAVGRHANRIFTHTYVTRWLGGSVPRDAGTRHAIAAALGERLGRTVAQEELGFGAAAPLHDDLGLAYPDRPDEGVDSLSQLWQADLNQVHRLLVAPVNSAAWHDAALSWLVTDSAASMMAQPTGRSVAPADVDRLRSTTDAFDHLDGQYGGGHARTAFVEYLSTELPALLRGDYSEHTGQELFRTAAQATLLCAWMSYDSAAHGLAQRYFIQSLRLADSSGDRLLASSVLDAMSHQATFLGRFHEAANLARAANQGSATHGSKALAAHFYVMEARALARVGDAAACDRAMSAAVREYEGRNADRDPEWFQYFDEAELAAELGHCNRDLGRAIDASSYAAQSVGLNGESARSDFFATMVLADAYLDQREVDQACEVALRALQIGEQLKSARCVTYVDEFRQRLSQVRDSPVVRDFTEQARATRLWTPVRQ